jgi:hypothetical protein
MGKDLITTLDTYMQDVAENAIMKMLVNNNSLHGTAIVMETATGKILKPLPTWVNKRMALIRKTSITELEK